MISALLWKEYREHRVVWAAIAFVGAASFLGLPLLLAPGGLAAHPEVREPLVGVAVMLVWIYGMVCGAMLLALEREMGTLPFLDALPGYRRQVWLAKFLAGVLLVLSQTAFLTAIAAAGRLFEDGQEAAIILGLTACFGLSGFAWGMLFSAYGRSVMNMILLAFVGQMAASVVAGCLTSLAGALIAAIRGEEYAVGLGFYWAVLLVLTVLLALVGSMLRFTRVDWSRSRPPLSPSIRPGKPRLAWSVLFWLTWRQARGFAVGLAAFALLLGCFVPADAVTLWPLSTLVVGMLCGVTTFADEQQGSFRFLGDQRLPLTRLWLVKVGLRFLIAVAGAVMVFLPTFAILLIRGPTSLPRYPGQYYPSFMALFFHSGLLASLWPPPLFLTMWLLYGFSAGCLYGLLFRNGLASGLFALCTAILLSAAWVPSLLGGGLNLWQVFGPPLILVASTRFVLRPWAAGRIASWTTAFRLAPFVVLALLWTAGGLWVRVLEIPEVAPKYDLDSFRAGLPKAEEDKAGRLVRAACASFGEQIARLQGMAPNRPPWPPSRPLKPAEVDLLGEGAWRDQLKEAADLPTGMAEDLRNFTAVDALKTPGPAPTMAHVLTLHGLRRQADGDDAAFVEDLRMGLCLSRTLRHYGTRRDAVQGKVAEDLLARDVNRWLEELTASPELPKKALEIFSRYLEETAHDDDDRILVDYLIARNTVDDPFHWLVHDLTNEAEPPGTDDAQARNEAAWVVQARMAPWEHERQERMLRVLFEGDDAQRRCLNGIWAPGAMLGSITRLDPTTVYPERDAFVRCRPSAAQLLLALRCYEADNGRPANNLEDLVPKYLSTLPPDPYGKGEPFHYRLSRGEEIPWPPDVEDAPAVGAPPPPATRKVAAGQGVLWSVGPDGRDDGGVRQAGRADGFTTPGEDLIILVPPPKGR